MECHSNWNVTKIGMSSNLIVTQNRSVTQIGMSLKLECHLNWKVTQIGMSLKLDVIQIGISHKLKSISNKKVNQSIFIICTGPDPLMFHVCSPWENHIIWNDPQIGTSLKLICHLN